MVAFRSFDLVHLPSPFCEKEVILNDKDSFKHLSQRQLPIQFKVDEIKDNNASIFRNIIV